MSGFPGGSGGGSRQYANVGPPGAGNTPPTSPPQGNPGGIGKGQEPNPNG
jgi:hypothetical protein